MSEAYKMRAPCLKCGSTEGTLGASGHNHPVRCACGLFQYHAPLTEIGERPSTISTTHNGVRPGQRARILMRDGGRCQLCGGPGDDVSLTVDHILSVKAGMDLGATEFELNSDANLCTLCEECNSGKEGVAIEPRLYLHILRARLAQERAQARRAAP